MLSGNEDGSPIAVIWYDGSQECKILNVSTTRDDNDAITDDSLPSRTCDNGDTSSNSDDDRTLEQRGIDNAAYVVHTEQDCVIEQIEDDSPSSSSAGVVDNESSNSRDKQVFYTTSLNSTSHSAVCPAASFSGETSNSNAHDNSAFEMPTELSYDAVVKRSPVHPNVYLVRRRNSSRELVTSCSCLTTGRRSSSDEVILQVQPSELVENISSNVVSNSDEAIENNKLHFLTSGTITPECNISITEITSCSDKKIDGEESSEPPPQYSSLRFMFLEDEPPKYQDVTGKKLTIGDPPKIQQTSTEKWKRRIIVVAVIIFIVLIGALLVYACFVSGHPLGAYGSVPRKF